MSPLFYAVGASGEFMLLGNTKIIVRCFNFALQNYTKKMTYARAHVIFLFSLYSTYHRLLKKSVELFWHRTLETHGLFRHRMDKCQHFGM